MAKKPAAQKTRTQIIDDIMSLMARHRGKPEDWYIGTAEDSRHQLFKIHGFKDTDIGLIRNAASSSDAASIADLLIGRGLRGTRGQKARAKSVYVFRIKKHTTPSSS